MSQERWTFAFFISMCTFPLPTLARYHSATPPHLPAAAQLAAGAPSSTMNQQQDTRLRRENSHLHPHNRTNENSASARNSWNSQAPPIITTTPHHNSTLMLTSNNFWGSTKALRDDWDPISTPHSPSVLSVACVGMPPEDPEGGRRDTGNLTAEGLSWRRLHMSRAKLKATATTSELLSGFAMVAMVELQINEPTNVPEWLFVLFAVCTTVLVSVHIFALMISTYILPNVDAVSKMQHMASPGGKDSGSHGESGNILESPHERMRGFIELAWAFSTVLGLFLFLVELAILCWVKFWDYSFTAAWSATIIVIPVLILFVVFVAHFYRSLVEQKVVATSCDLDNLEAMRSNLHEVEVGYENSCGPATLTAPPSPSPSVVLCPPSPQQFTGVPHTPGPYLSVPDSGARFIYPPINPNVRANSPKLPV